MLKNESAGKEREGRALNSFRVDRHDRDLEKISDRFEEPLLVDFAGIEDLGCPRTAVKVRRKFRRFLSRRHAARHEQIDQRITDRRIHALILLESGRIVMRRANSSWSDRSPDYFIPGRSGLGRTICLSSIGAVFGQSGQSL